MKKTIWGILLLASVSGVNAKAGTICQGQYNDIAVSGTESMMTVKFLDSGKGTRFNGKVVKMKLEGHDGSSLYYVDHIVFDPKARAYVEPSVVSRGIGMMSVHLKLKGGKNDHWQRFGFVCR